MKMLNVKLVLCAAVLLFFGKLSGQIEMAPDQFKGYLILDKKGKKREGVIELNSLKNPWENQRRVKFIEEKAFEGKKLKDKDKEEFKPKDIEGFVIGDRVFETQKYTDLGSAVEGDQVNRVTGLASLGSALTKNEHFLERITQGAITLYKFYSEPPAVKAAANKDQSDALDQMEENSRRHYDILVKKGDEKLRNFKNINMEEYFSDCPEVWKKYQDGGYKMEPKGLKGLLSKALPGDLLQEMALEMVNDYNRCKQ